MRDEGHAAVELAFAVGVLLLPVALVVTGFGPWSERRVEAEAIAAEAARAAVLDLSHEAGHGAVSSMTSTLGIPAGLVLVGWCNADPAPEPAGSCSFERGAVVSITVELWTPLVDTPWGAVGGLWVVGEHSEPIDLYRSLG
ncbi:MAG TPA: hypothetical protein VF148_13435 [Acidimicrobiia bacterium]